MAARAEPPLVPISTNTAVLTQLFYRPAGSIPSGRPMFSDTVIVETTNAPTAIRTTVIWARAGTPTIRKTTITALRIPPDWILSEPAITNRTTLELLSDFPNQK